MTKIKLYKLRALTNCNELNKIKEIVESGKFWCSNFADMNDPMEGVYYASDKSKIEDIYNEKNTYKICSFSGENGFKNPIMWGYYASGFKGIAIEIEIDKDNVKEISYSNLPTTLNAEEILTTKLPCWEKENEYRYLTKDEGNKHLIGKITKIYIGNPYNDIDNKDTIRKNNNKLRKYQILKKKLESFLNSLQIEYEDVKINTN